MALSPKELALKFRSEDEQLSSPSRTVGNAKALAVRLNAMEDEPSRLVRSQQPRSDPVGGGTFTRSLQRGTKQTAGLYGEFVKAIGDKTGFSSLVEYGDDLIEDAFVEAITNPAEITDLSEITSFNKAFTWAAQAFGEQFLNLGIAVGSGGLGALAGRAAIGKAAMRALGKKPVPLRWAKDANKLKKHEVIDRYLKMNPGKGKGAGALAGVYAGFYPINTGEVFQEQQEAFGKPGDDYYTPGGEIDFAGGLMIGGASTLFETLGAGVIGKALFGKYSKEAVESVMRTVLRRFGHTSLQGLAAEGGTEYVQEALAITAHKLNDPTFSISAALTSGEAQRRMLFAGATGALIGGVLGGAGGAVQGARTLNHLGHKKAHLRSQMEANPMLEDAFSDTAEGEAQTLFDIDNARASIGKMVDTFVGKIDNVKKAFGFSEKGQALGEADQEASLAALYEARETVLKALAQETRGLDASETQLRRTLAALNRQVEAMQATRANIPIAEKRDGDANDTTKAANDRVRELIAEINKIRDPKAGGKKATELFNEALKLLEQGMGDPNAVSADGIRRLINAASKKARAGLNKVRKQQKSYRDMLKHFDIRIQQQMTKLEKVAKPIAERIQLNRTVEQLTAELEQLEAEAGAAQAEALAQEEAETLKGKTKAQLRKFIPERLRKKISVTKGKLTRASKKLAKKTAAKTTAVVAADPEAAEAQQEKATRQERAKTTSKLSDDEVKASLDRVIFSENKNELAIAQGWTMAEVHAKFPEELNGGNLRLTMDDKQTYIGKEGIDWAAAKAEAYPGLDNVDPDNAVVIKEGDKETVVNKDEAAARVIKEDFPAEVKTPADTILARVEVRNQEAAGRTTTVRIYDENMNEVDREAVEDNPAVVNATIKRLSDENGLYIPSLAVFGAIGSRAAFVKELVTFGNRPTGYAYVSDSKLHNSLMKDDKTIYGGLYQALWKLKKGGTQPGKLVFSPTLPLDTVIGKVKRPPRKLRNLRLILKKLRGDIEDNKTNPRTKIKNANRKREWEVTEVTYQMLLDAREDAQYIVDMMANLVNQHQDPQTWLEKSVNQPQLEEQTALFEQFIDRAVKNELGAGQSATLLSNLVEQPLVIWGVSQVTTGKNKGRPSTQLVELKETSEGWIAVKSGKPAYKFGKEELDTLERKLTAAAVKKFQKYGKIAKTEVETKSNGRKVIHALDEDGNEVWQVGVERIAPGFYGLQQSLPGLDDNVTFLQLRKIEDRAHQAGQWGQKYKDTVTVQAVRPDGKSTFLHLGEITTLGRLQRIGPGNMLLGNQLTQAHENFMYGLATLMGMGYKIAGTEAGGPWHDLVVTENSKFTWGRAWRIIFDQEGTYSPQEKKEAQAWVDRVGPWYRKKILGPVTLKDSLTWQKSLRALDWFLKDTRTYPEWAGGRETETGLFELSELVADPDTASIADIIEALLDKIVQRVELAEPMTAPRRIRKANKKWVADLKKQRLKEGKTEPLVVYEADSGIGTLIIEETPTSFRVSKKGVPAALMHFPKTLNVRQRRFRDSAPLLSGGREKFVVPVKVSTEDTIGRINQAIYQSLRDEPITDKEVSTLISLYGLHDHSLQLAMEATLNDNRAEPSGAPDILDNPIGSTETVAADEEYISVLAEYDSREEVDFQERRDRGLFGENETSERPYLAQIPAKEALPEAKPSLTNRFVEGNKQVANHIAGWDIVKPLKTILQRIKLKERIILFDDDAIPSLRVKFEKIAKDRYASVTERAVAKSFLESLDAIENDKTPARLIIPTVKDSAYTERALLIYISNKYNPDNHSRGWRLAHELGHIIQHRFFHALSPATQRQIMDSMEDGVNAPIETLANWVAVQLSADTPNLTGADTSTRKAFQVMKDQLRAVYEWAKRQWGNRFRGPLLAPENIRASRLQEKIYTLQDFIAGIYTYVDHPSGDISLREEQARMLTPFGKQIWRELQAAGGSPFIQNQREGTVVSDFDQPPATPAKPGVLDNYWQDAQHLATTFIEDPRKALRMSLYSVDSELRAIAKGNPNHIAWKIADTFHSRPGTKDPSLTMFRKIEQWSAPFHDRMETILNKIPSARIGAVEALFGTKLSAKKKALRAERDAIQKALLLQTDIKDVPVEIRAKVAMIRKYFADLRSWFTSKGLKLKDRKNYFPLMMMTQKVMENSQQFMDIFVKRGWSKERAKAVHGSIMRDENGGLTTGFISDNERVDFDFEGPGFASALPRNEQWTDGLRADLIEAGFYQPDIATVMIAYTQMMMTRAAWQTKYRETDVGEEVDAGLLTGNTPTGQMVNTLVLEYEAAGLNIHNPVARLQMDLVRAQRRKEITPWEFKRIARTLLPAYAGQLGLRVDPKIRKLSAFAVIYQNLRVLPAAIFAQYVDVGTLMLRGDFKAFQQATKLLVDKATREEAYTMLKELGGMRYGTFEHVLNDQAANTFMTGNAKRINDLFFKYNLMEPWTNMIRAAALISGRSFIKRNAALALEGNEKAQHYMDVLGLGSQAQLNKVMEWDEHTTPEGDQLKAALNRYIDEAMIRPTAAIRPAWFSDPGYGVFTHLKQFLWGFHATFMQYALRELNVKGGLKAHHNLAPLLLLGLMTLPFAAIGYELRRKVTGSKSNPEGFAYVQELAERAGLLGPAQLLLDMEQAADFGKPYIIGASAPMTEQVYDFLNTDDYRKTFAKALPVVAAFPHARRWVTDNLPEIE